MAQPTESPIITVASVTRGEPATKVALPIEVGPKRVLARNSFVRIRGLPPTVAVSEGHAIAPGVWAVPLTALPTLSLFLPAGLQGTSQVVVNLVGPDGNVLAEAKTALTVAAPAAAKGAADAVPSAAPTPAPPKLSQPDRERALALHAKGLEQLERGNVYAARKFFERAADIGLAQSAVAVAGTYDPDELAKLKVVGISPDLEAARRWYERARTLGATEAAERLKRLGARQ
jgi:hypothetical protein